MSEMIKRVAEAMRFAVEGPRGDFKSADDAALQSWMKPARAAIEAMREPTDAMVAAGVDADIPGGRFGEPTFRESSINDQDAPVIWRDMIDAALKPQP